MLEAQKTLNDNLKEVVNDLETKSLETIEHEKIKEEIKQLRAQAKLITDTDAAAVKQIEEINSQIENLIKRIRNM